jgi:hypothetical protein
MTASTPDSLSVIGEQGTLRVMVDLRNLLAISLLVMAP